MGKKVRVPPRVRVRSCPGRSARGTPAAYGGRHRRFAGRLFLLPGTGGCGFIQSSAEAEFGRWVPSPRLVAAALRQRRFRHVLGPEGSGRLHGGLRHRGGGSGVRGLGIPLTPSWVPHRGHACGAGFFHLCAVGFTGDAARAVLSPGPDARHHGQYVPEGPVFGWFLLVTTHLALYSFSCRQAQMLGISAGMGTEGQLCASWQWHVQGWYCL